ncbi:hypothetical protein SAMN02744775_00762 [Enterobacter sp. CC120223-11]|nr:hypothetical protein SAMN02744775_00762 [Enterobacter sp. CC120223-11]
MHKKMIPYFPMKIKNIFCHSVSGCRCLFARQMSKVASMARHALTLMRVSVAPGRMTADRFAVCRSDGSIVVERV